MDKQSALSNLEQIIAEYITVLRQTGKGVSADLIGQLAKQSLHAVSDQLVPDATPADPSAA